MAESSIDPLSESISNPSITYRSAIDPFRWSILSSAGAWGWELKNGFPRNNNLFLVKNTNICYDPHGAPETSGAKSRLFSCTGNAGTFRCIPVLPVHYFLNRAAPEAPERSGASGALFSASETDNAHFAFDYCHCARACLQQKVPSKKHHELFY